MHHKPLMIDEFTTQQVRQANPFSGGRDATPLELSYACLIHRKRLTMDIGVMVFQESFSCLRLRAGHGFPRSPISVPGLPPKRVPVQP